MCTKCVVLVMELNAKIFRAFAVIFIVGMKLLKDLLFSYIVGVFRSWQFIDLRIYNTVYRSEHVHVEFNSPNSDKIYDPILLLKYKL